VDDLTYESAPQGTHTLSYKWLYSATEEGTYAEISGATDDEYVTGAAGWYKVQVTATGMVTGTVTSDATECVTGD